MLETTIKIKYCGDYYNSILTDFRLKDSSKIKICYVNLPLRQGFPPTTLGRQAGQNTQRKFSLKITFMLTL